MMYLVKFDTAHIVILLIVFSLCNCEHNSKSDHLDKSGTEKLSVSDFDKNSQNDLPVARVNGKIIRFSDIQSLITDSEGQVNVRDAVEAVIRNELLSQEARRRGYENSTEVRISRRNAIAELVIKREVESVVLTELTEEQLKANYEANIKKYVHGIKRRTAHCLARTGPNFLSEEEARRVAEKVRVAALSAVDEDDFLKRVKPIVENSNKTVLAEKLPFFEADSTNFVKPFVDAAFSISKVGELSTPSKTDYGFHIIYLAEELPAQNRLFDEVREEIRKSLLPRLQKERSDAFMSRLQSKTKVFIYEQALKEGSLSE